MSNMNHKISFQPNAVEIMNTEQPDTVAIDGVEIPSWYKVWKELRRTERKSGSRVVQCITMICAVVSLVLSILALLWR